MTATAAVLAYVGAGSNLGDRHGHLRRARARLDETPGLRVVAVSSTVESPAVGGPPQPDFVNVVFALESELPARALLSVCQAIERESGRSACAERFTPRPLDLDLLLFGDQRIDEPGLAVPHPRLRDRPFVVGPLRELGVEPDRCAPPRDVRIVTPRDEVRARCETVRRGGRVIGFVPTMGALHAGHVSLLDAARNECDFVVASIFVNPLQFDEAADLDAYPRTLDADVDACRRAGVDLLWTPGSLYGEGFASRVAVGREAEGMEGAMRPGHFGGVATVVALLLTAVGPDRAYFGQKDAQQLAVVRRLHTDLGLRGTIVECPTVREDDGLAMSSRNVRLTPPDRAAAPVLHRAMAASRDRWRGGERGRDRLIDTARGVLDSESRCTVDYVDLRAAEDLRSLPDDVPDDRTLRMLVAARFGDVRLIDNLVFERD